MPLVQQTVSKHIPVVPFGERNVLPKPATTEFQTQELELDTAIVHLDEDLYWHIGQWQCKHTKIRR